MGLVAPVASECPCSREARKTRIRSATAVPIASSRSSCANSTRNFARSLRPLPAHLRDLRRQCGLTGVCGAATSNIDLLLFELSKISFQIDRALLSLIDYEDSDMLSLIREGAVLKTHRRVDRLLMNCCSCVVIKLFRCTNAHHGALPATDFLNAYENVGFRPAPSVPNPTMSLTSSDLSSSLALAKRYCSFLKSIVAPFLLVEQTLKQLVGHGRRLPNLSGSEHFTAQVFLLFGLAPA